MNITNNTVLITGGSSGIGLSLARVFSRNNTVIVCGRNAAKLKAVQKQNPDIIPLVCDIARKDEQQDLINTLAQKYPQLNILINNAGIQRTYDFTDRADHRALIDEETDINFVAPMRLIDQLLPFIKKECIQIWPFKYGGGD